MRVSAKSDYALRALIEIARQTDGGAVSADGSRSKPITRVAPASTTVAAGSGGAVPARHSGLGLAIVASIARAHGWTVDPGDYDLVVAASAGDVRSTVRVSVG